MSRIFKGILGGRSDIPSHKWERKRTYDLPGPRYQPTVVVSQCSRCKLVKEKSRWHDPNPQYFESDTRNANRVTDPSVISRCTGQLP